MALSVVRKGVTYLTGRAGRGLVTPIAVVRPQVATIVSNALRPRDYKRPLPYPYKESSYGLFHAMMDKTMHRLDENSKVIVVDGPIAVGKTKFAKEIAEELDMLYVPEANMDMLYINKYGYDLRQLDPQLPDVCKSFDIEDFLSNPKHWNVARLQLEMLQTRLNQYIDALAHVLSTGQGVVMDRSVYSDLVFADTLAHFGYISKQVHNYYYECRKMTLPALLRPHLVIYLDIPVDVCLQRIKARNLPHETNSPVLTPEFLAQMEHVYKQRYLKEISKHSQMLVYDWSDEGDAEVVVEDIERLNFEFDKNDTMMFDWKFPDEWAWCEKRMDYTGKKHFIMSWLQVPDYDVKELVITAEDSKVFTEVWWNAPGQKFEPGFNKDMGDTGLLTKVAKEA